jgi:RHS repeat-associated protein
MTEPDGNLFMRARFYDPATGRFLTKDPVQGSFDNPLTLHKYLYALGNPLAHVDPQGTQAALEYLGIFAMYFGFLTLVGILFLWGIDTTSTGQGEEDVENIEYVQTCKQALQDSNTQTCVEAAGQLEARPGEVQVDPVILVKETKGSGLPEDRLSVYTPSRSKTYASKNVPSIPSVQPETYSQTHTSTTRKY